jgi:DNA adenine methylase/adenine-specific DNA-methyltransferase
LPRCSPRWGGTSALDAFSGSGVVSYLLKSLGYQVTSNDFLTFPTVIATATMANQTVKLTRADIERICGPAADERNFIQSTFDGLYFTVDDRRFLDSAWSHLDRLTGNKRALASRVQQWPH